MIVFLRCQLCARHCVRCFIHISSNLVTAPQNKRSSPLYENAKSNCSILLYSVKFLSIKLKSWVLIWFYFWKGFISHKVPCNLASFFFSQYVLTVFSAYEKCQTDGVENESCTNWRVSFLMFILWTSLIEKYNKITLGFFMSYEGHWFWKSKTFSV